jgi:GNAT superfamily N-acetyltransferase
LYRDLDLRPLRCFLHGRDSYTRRCHTLALGAECGGVLGAAALCVWSDDSDLLRLSFLEFLPDASECFSAQVAHARALAAERGLARLVIGVDGQLSYGVGLCEGGPFEFGSTYNPAYYVPLLDSLAPGLGLTRKRAHAFEFDVRGPQRHRDDAVVAAVAADPRYTIRPWDDFDRDIFAFGELCDRTLTGTACYTPKSAAEMAETMRTLRPLLAPADLLFACCGGEPVGCLFTHPDWAERLRFRHTTAAEIYLTAKLRPSGTRIVNYIGVLPEHRGRGLALALAHELLNRVPVKRLISAFVLRDNQDSYQLDSERAEGIHRAYALYETAV